MNINADYKTIQARDASQKVTKLTTPICSSVIFAMLTTVTLSTVNQCGRCLPSNFPLLFSQGYRKWDLFRMWIVDQIQQTHISGLTLACVNSHCKICPFIFPPLKGQ